MYKILIADDHAVVRQGLKRILATASDMTVVGEAGSRLDVLTMLRQPVDALTLDLAMPGTDGMALLTEVKTLYRSLPIVVLSMYSDPPYVKRALKLGALRFYPQDGGLDRIGHGDSAGHSWAILCQPDLR